MPSRPYISWNVADLDNLFDQQKSDVVTLQALLIELSHRRTRAAADLREKVLLALSAIQPREAPRVPRNLPSKFESRYSAFLSYARVDQEPVAKVRSIIDKSNLASWLDTEGLTPGVDWEPTLRRALVQSDTLLVLVTANIPGTYVEQEIELATDMRKPIIPIVFDDFVFTDHPLAKRLRQIQFLDFRPNRPNLSSELVRMLKVFHLAPVLAVYSVKGGTGKTTLSANSSAYLFKKERKSVLCIDMDPQANLSTLLVRPEIRVAGMRGRQSERVDVLESLRRLNHSVFGLLERCKERDAFSSGVGDVQTFIHNLDVEDDKRFDIVPGDSRLAQNALRDITDEQRRQIRLGFGRFVERCRSAYDCILIDMNPSVSHLTLLSLSSATDILSPIKPDLFSMQSVDLINELISENEEAANGVGRVIVINQPQLDPGRVVRGHIEASALKDRLVAAELSDSKDFRAQASTNLSEGLGWMVAYGNWGPRPSPARQSLRAVVKDVADKIGMRLDS